MNNLIPTTADETLPSEKMEVVIPAKTEHKFIASLKPHKGHTCYEMNLATRTIRPAVFEEVTLDMFAKKSMAKVARRKKLIVQPDCIYCTALNTKNALKRFIQMLTLHHARTHHSQPEQTREAGQYSSTESGTGI